MKRAAKPKTTNGSKIAAEALRAMLSDIDLLVTQMDGLRAALDAADSRDLADWIEAVHRTMRAIRQWRSIYRAALR